MMPLRTHLFHFDVRFFLAHSRLVPKTHSLTLIFYWVRQAISASPQYARPARLFHTPRPILPKVRKNKKSAPSPGARPNQRNI
jgi:hypothetical protein